MTALELDTNYVWDGTGKLIHELQKPLVQALLGTWLSGAQSLELALWDLYEALFVAHAAGAALDQLGALVGQPRENRSDASYRAWISARIFINRSAGVPNDSLLVISIVDSSAVAELTDYVPASYVVTVTSIGALAGPDLFALLGEVRPAGVGMMLANSTFAPTEVLTLGDANAPPAFSVATGLGDDGQSTGGHFMSVIG